MEWPSKSPDLNPIEHIWATMKHYVACKLRPGSNLDDLRRVVLAEWHKMPIGRVSHNRLPAYPRQRFVPVLQSDIDSWLPYRATKIWFSYEMCNPA